MMGNKVIKEEDFNRLLREQITKTSFSEEEVRQIMFSILKKNGFTLQEASLVEQIAHARMIAGENAVIKNLREKGL